MMYVCKQLALMPVIYKQAEFWKPVSLCLILQTWLSVHGRDRDMDREKNKKKFIIHFSMTCTSYTWNLKESKLPLLDNCTKIYTSGKNDCKIDIQSCLLERWIKPGDLRGPQEDGPWILNQNELHSDANPQKEK